MAQFYKTKDNEINTEFFDYFKLNDINNYENIYLINSQDYQKVVDILSLNNIVIFENNNSKTSINDNNPIYLNLKLLNNANVIYLKDELNILNDDNIKSFITSFKEIIICNIELQSYLKDLNMLKEYYKLQENNYIKIDKYGNIELRNL